MAGEQKKEARMERKHGIGSIAAMTALIAAMTWVRTLRWNALGLVDRVMIVVLWVVVAAAATALGLTAWRYWRVRVESRRRGRRVGSKNAAIY
jgi:uncharacterized protein involved in response to NO